MNNSTNNSRNEASRGRIASGSSNEEMSRHSHNSNNNNNNNVHNYNPPTTPVDQEIISATSGAAASVWNEESFSEDQFLSSSFPGGSSWEEASQSFDSEFERRGGGGSRSSSTAARERRKRFDTTTPTLIDEEDIHLDHHHQTDEDHDEITSASFVLDHSRDDSVLSTNSMYHRRTPGAAQMHQSSTPGVGGEYEQNDPLEPPAVAEPRPPLAPSQGEERGTRGPFVFTPWAKTSTAASSSDTRAFSPNILRLTEDIGNLLHEDEDDDDAYAIEIPSVFRGDQQQQQQQLQAQQGDGETGTSDRDYGGDWTGSYVFDQQDLQPQQPKYGRNKEGRVKRRHFRDQSQGSTGSSGAGFSQPQQGASGGTASSFFFPPVSATVQPRPARSTTSGSESDAKQQQPVLFEFGKPQPPASQEQGQPPQLVHFGGAFAPPAQARNFPHQQQHGAEQSQPTGQPIYLRPVQSAEEGNSPFAPHVQHQMRPVPHVNSGSQVYGMTSPSFESYQHQQLVHPVPLQFVPLQPGMPVHNYGSGMPPPQQGGGQFHHGQPQQYMEMQSSPLDFVPMQNRSSTPGSYAFHSPRQQHWQDTPPPNFEPQAPPEVIEMGGSWHSGAPPARSPAPAYAMPSSGYGDDSVARASTTPSPHISSWQTHPPQPDVGAHGIMSSASMEPSPRSMHPSAVASSAGGHAAAPSPDVSLGNRSKKEAARRNTRPGRKKKGKGLEKSSPNASSSGATTKKKSKEGSRAASVASNDGTVDEAAASGTDDAAYAKRAELEESPSMRMAFKDFYRNFRGEEKYSYQRAEELALRTISDGSLPESIHWRVYLEMADLARRSNRYLEARKLFQKVCEVQPFASQGWLEYSKLEEDCGFMNRVSNILHSGLEYCEHNEGLLTRAVKHQERMGNLAASRGILAKLKHVGIDKVWRTVLEGALVEARAGNRDMARRVLKYLMHHVPWYGPLYLEAYKLERDQDHHMEALQIVERGLTTLPRYGPLWFSAFRLYEEMDITEGQFDLPRTMIMIERAKCTISKELVWKLHLEAAQMLERTALAYVEESGLDLEAYLQPVRRRLILTILTCPQNLRWKVWLAAGRMELVVGNVGAAHQLFQRAHHCVQQKSKSATLLDCARLAEFNGDVDLVRGILTKARSFYCHDWKVWFESVLVEIRNDNHSRGYDIAASGLELHMGSGRLWATLVQLGQLVGGDEMQIAALERALSAVPKSGEVWCEGARIHLNPFSCTFDLHRSRRYLHFATRFTPQFGDSFIELIRLEILTQWLFPVAKYIWKKTKGSFNITEATRNSGLAKYVSDVYQAIAVARRKDLEHPKVVPETKFRDIVGTLRKKLKSDNLRSCIDLTDLRLACTNADPNYGSLWFHCRRLPMYTPMRVIELAAEDVADEVFKYANIYLAAMIRRMAVIATIDREMPQGADSTIETSDPAIIHWENYIDMKLRDAISLQDIFDPADLPADLALLESAMRGSIFITGLSELNRYRPLESMTLLERRRTLFGTDALFP